MSKSRERVVLILKRLLARLGYSVRPISSSAPMPLLSFDGNPRSLRYLNRKRHFLITGKMDDGRSLFVFSLGSEGGHPFVEAVREALGRSLPGGDGRQSIHSKLLEFYSSYQPGCAAEVLGASGDDIPMLGSQPPWVVIKPWEDLTVEERIEKIIKTEKEDNSQVSTSDISIEHGCNFCGPVSGDKLVIEVERLYAIAKSVSKNGFQRHDFVDGDIRADILVQSSGDWRWVVKSGHHRVSVLSALGFQEVPIRVETIVCRDEVDVWPQVLAGNYTREMALKVFDNMFSGVGAHEKKKRALQSEDA